MLLLAFLAASAVAPIAPEHRPAVLIQAKAGVRIVAGERISSRNLPSNAVLTDAKVTGADGIARTAVLVEFP